MRGKRIEPIDRATADYIAHRRIWRGWRLVLLIVGTPCSAWLVFHQVSIGVSGRNWLGAVLWGMSFILLLVTIRRQVYLRRWKRAYGEK